MRSCGKLQLRPISSLPPNPSLGRHSHFHFHSHHSPVPSTNKKVSEVRKIAEFTNAVRSLTDSSVSTFFFGCPFANFVAADPIIQASGPGTYEIPHQPIHSTFTPHLPPLTDLLLAHLLIGIPSPAAGGETLFDGPLGTFSFPSFPSASSTLVSLFKKLLSLTGLPLANPPATPICTFPLPEPPFTPLTPGDVRCGMFSGRGCSEPTLPVSTLEALPALERA